MYILLCVTDVCSAGPTVVFIVCHSVLSSQSIYVYTFILSLESFTTTCYTHTHTHTHTYIYMCVCVCVCIVSDQWNVKGWY